MKGRGRTVGWPKGSRSKKVRTIGELQMAAAYAGDTLTSRLCDIAGLSDRLGGSEARAVCEDIIRLGYTPSRREEVIAMRKRG